MEKIINFTVKTCHLILGILCIGFLVYPTIYNFANPELTQSYILREKGIFYIYAVAFHFARIII